MAGAADRRRGREARTRELRAEPWPDCGDRGGAHDRHRARHLRRGARQRLQGLEPRGHRGSGGRRLRRHIPGRLLAFVAGAGDAIAASDDAEHVTNVRSDLGKVGDASTYVTGIEPDTIAEGYSFDWKQGSDAVARPARAKKAIVDANFAEDHDIAVGDTVALLTPRARRSTSR